MDQLDKMFCNKLSSVCYSHFKSLPKTGKPNSNEWTVLSCIIKEDVSTSTCEVVALGTGSKCIGIDKMSNAGDILNDSHAEVVCRRSFLGYIYEEMLLAIKKSSSIFLQDQKKFKLMPNIKFNFFTTHVPCGDAAIFPKADFEDVGNSIDQEDDGVAAKRIKGNNNDIYRTGAKCLSSSKNRDLYSKGNAYHVIGVVRTKPGRGSPTLSVSCSDKISKWCHVGIQGALLGLLLEEPIYLKSFIIAGGVPCDKGAIKRAFYERLHNFNLKPPYIKESIFIGQADTCFEFSKDSNKRPSPCSIIWFKFIKKVEVAVEGRRQGVTRKTLSTNSGRLSICKRNLMGRFLKVTKQIGLNWSNLNYDDLKQTSLEYETMWRILKNDGFITWTVDKNKFNKFFYA